MQADHTRTNLYYEGHTRQLHIFASSRPATRLFRGFRSKCRIWLRCYWFCTSFWGLGGRALLTTDCVSLMCESGDKLFESVDFHEFVDLTHCTSEPGEKRDDFWPGSRMITLPGTVWGQASWAAVVLARCIKPWNLTFKCYVFVQPDRVIFNGWFQLIPATITCTTTTTLNIFLEIIFFLRIVLFDI